MPGQAGRGVMGKPKNLHSKVSVSHLPSQSGSKTSTSPLRGDPCKKDFEREEIKPHIVGKFSTKESDERMMAFCKYSEKCFGMDASLLIIIRWHKLE